MAIAFTPEQEQVIQLHNRNILVSAAAGSGKTAVLVERIVRMVCDEEHPVDIDRLLIVTFTNAAAAEMRERISQGIADKLKEQPESEHIQKQATLLHNAQITTIDSFCLFIIRNHFHEIGLDPAFRVADDSEIKLMEQDVLAELLEEAFASKDMDFFHCVEFFCPGGRESVLENYILKLSHHAASCPFPEEWLEERKADYSARTLQEFAESPVGQELLHYVNQMLEGCIEKLKDVQRLCQSPDGPYMYGELVDKELEALEGLRKWDSLEEYSARVPNVEFGRLPTKKDDSVSPMKREMAKELRGQVKDTISGLGEDLFKTPLELALQQSAECDCAVKKLVELTIEFDRRMKAEKLEKKMIDFSDMEHYALDILLDKEDGKVKPSRVALEYRQFFYEILIDEYQDSNLVQEYLLKAVSGEDSGQFNRFMVGDVKQSIYRFRLARPEIFQEKYESYEVGGSEKCRIDLSRNFRSRTQVVDTVNSVFEKIMSWETGGLVYDESAALYTAAAYPESDGCESELLLIEKPGKEDEMGSKEAEALAIAHRIHELKRNFQVTEKNGALRPVKYSDMVILLRSNQGWDDVFKRVLEREGIPVYITSKTGYFAATEVQELLQVLRVLDNPRQDIPLYGMLKSVFGGFAEEEIALIRARRKMCTLYEALCELAAAGGEKENETAVDGDDASDEGVETVLFTAEQLALSKRAKAFVDKLRKYREYTVYMPIRELLQRLVEDHDYLNYVTALPAGSKRKANVEMLFTKASDFEKTSYFGLFHFVRYMEQLEKYDVDYGEAGLLDENADVVRIMSIHKSKGLEFPVTFVAGLSKRFNLQEYSQALVVDMDLGLGTTYVDPVKRIKNKTLRQQVLARRLKLENFAEELRILYVALTRAREKLILTATMSKAAEKWEIAKEQASSKLSFSDFAQANTYLDFLMPVLARTELQVAIKDAGWMEEEELGEQLYLADKVEALRGAGDYADEECAEILRQRLSFVYPYKNLENLYTKTTVSELKAEAMAERDEAAFHAFEEREIVPYIPAFRRDKEEVSGTVRGNAFHRAMELMDFEAIVGDCFGEVPASYENYTKGITGVDLHGRISTFLEAEVAAMHLSREYFDALNLKKLVVFMESQYAWRMWAADRRGELYREQPFVLGVGAERVAAEFPKEEMVLIQGIIDVFWVEDGEIVLLDYKTDVIGSGQELRNRYETQLIYYQEALERLMKMDVKEKVLYSFYLQKGC
ncbi:MAG: helicase-exonuclease AddAB subunit AddA [Lachnospiraceae bacterium]|nr:helicase-exonuclease AddAB subunit AddA [Lachnospiraceae bacterium]